MRFSRLILVAAGAFALCGSDRAQWGGGSCGSLSLPMLFAQSQPAPSWQWVHNGEAWGLLRNGRQVGGFAADGNYYRYLGGDRWDREPSEPPTTPPAEVLEAKKKKCGCCKGCACKEGKCGCKPGARCSDGCKCQRGKIGAETSEADDEDEAEQPPEALRPPREVPNYGVVWDKISPDEKVSVNGREVTRAEADRAIEGGGASGTVPDDSAKLSLTLIGPKEACDHALADLQAPEYAQLREHCVIQAYRPDDVMIDKKHAGFVTDGEPRVYLQAPGGVPLYNVCYEGPQTWEAIRKADPNYDPAKDPPRKGSAPESEGGGGLLVAVIGGGVVFGVFVFIAFVGVLILFVRWLRK